MDISEFLQSIADLNIWSESRPLIACMCECRCVCVWMQVCVCLLNSKPKRKRDWDRERTKMNNTWTCNTDPLPLPTTSKKSCFGSWLKNVDDLTDHERGLQIGWGWPLATAVAFKILHWPGPTGLVGCLSRTSRLIICQGHSLALTGTKPEAP